MLDPCNGGLSFWFFGKTLNGVFALCHELRLPLFVFHHKVRDSNVSRTFWPRITTFHWAIRTGPLFNLSGYDIISFFRSEVIAKKLSKMPLPMALGLIFTKTFKRWAWHFCTPIEDMSLTNLPDMASLSWFRSAVKYNNTAQKCVELVRSAKSRIVRPLFNVESPNFTRTSMSSSLQPHWIWRHQLLPVGIYPSKFRNVGFGSNFSGTAFCLPHQLMGFLFLDWLRLRLATSFLS